MEGGKWKFWMVGENEVGKGSQGLWEKKWGKGFGVKVGERTQIN